MSSRKVRTDPNHPNSTIGGISFPYERGLSDAERADRDVENAQRYIRDTSDPLRPGDPDKALDGKQQAAYDLDEQVREDARLFSGSVDPIEGLEVEEGEIDVEPTPEPGAEPVASRKHTRWQRLWGLHDWSNWVTEEADVVRRNGTRDSITVQCRVCGVCGFTDTRRL